MAHLLRTCDEQLSVVSIELGKLGPGPRIQYSGLDQQHRLQHACCYPEQHEQFERCEQHGLKLLQHPARHAGPLVAAAQLQRRHCQCQRQRQRPALKPRHRNQQHACERANAAEPEAELPAVRQRQRLAVILLPPENEHAGARPTPRLGLAFRPGCAPVRRAQVEPQFPLPGLRQPLACSPRPQRESRTNL